MVNPSTALALDISKALLKIGVTDVVVCPGSRSAPIAWQLAELANQNRVRLHTRIDEREAGFFALGIAKATRRPVPVVVTSGTAVANLLPAVVEAYHSGIALIVVSADRPEIVRGNSAGQTTNQVGIFNNFVKAQIDTAVPSQDILATLAASITDHLGPVHINAQFDMPLMPDDLTIDFGQIEQITVQSSDLPEIVLDLPAKGLLIVGDVATQQDANNLIELAEKSGYPIIWEPSSNVPKSENVIDHGALLLQAAKIPQPEVVVTAGLVGLSRSVLNLLKVTPRHIAIALPTGGPEKPNPVLSAEQILNCVPNVKTNLDRTWLNLWRNLSITAEKIVTNKLNSQTLTGPSAAVTVWNEIPNGCTLVVAPSWPIRHLEMYAQSRTGLTTFANRGVNGIDGLISTAAGISVTQSNRTYLLIGDIAFLHGMGGLNVSAPNQKPNLTIVVIDNDGSGIFSQLEQGAAKYEKYFEQIFGTPHGKDLWVVAESLGIPASRVTTKSELLNALSLTNKIPGMHVIVCTTGSRQLEQNLISEISQEVTTAI